MDGATRAARRPWSLPPWWSCRLGLESLRSLYRRHTLRAGANSTYSDLVDRAFARDLDRPAEGPLRLRLRPGGVQLVGQVGEHEPPGARLAPVLARLGGVMWPTSEAGSVPSMSSSSASCANVHRSSEGEESAPNTKRRPSPAAAVTAIAWLVTKCGTTWKRSVSGPTCSGASASYSRRSNAFSTSASSPHAPTTRRKRSRPPGGACSAGRAALRVLPRPVRERVGERDEVEDVVGVQVREDDGVDRGVVREAAQLREDAAAAVDQHPAALLLHEVAGAGTVDVLP